MYTGGLIGRISTSMSVKTRPGRSRSNSISSNEATKQVITPQKYQSKLYGVHRKSMKVQG